MNIYIIIILVYLACLTVMNFWKSRRIKTQDDMMLAGRSISMTKMVFTLICTWIGSGTFISGAEFAAKAGWSAMWQVAGVGVGIIIIYFLAAKIRTFGQYTVGDILEVRYGPVARVFGAIAIIISFTTIVSYQFKAGGYILNTISDGSISNEQGMFLAFLFVTIFTMIGGMVAIANTDLPNGIIILSAMIISTPLVIIAAGSFSQMHAVLPSTHVQVFNPTFTYNPPLKILAMGISTLLLLLGVQSMYQKFYSARNPGEARRAAGMWVVGTLFIEAVAVIVAIFATVHFWDRLQAGAMDHAEVIVRAAREMIPLPVGVLLLGAATVVVISTGMNYLLSPTTTLIRDIIQRFYKLRGSEGWIPAVVILKVKNYLSAPMKTLFRDICQRVFKSGGAEDVTPASDQTDPESDSGVAEPRFIAAFAIIIALFLPWFKSGGINYMGFQVHQFLAETPVFVQIGGFVGFFFKAFIYLTPVLGLIVIIFTIKKKSTDVVGLIAGLLPFGALGIILLKSNAVLEQMGVGVYFTMIAGLALIIYRSSEKIEAAKKVVLLQKFLIVLVGVTAYLMATQMRSVMENALFAYTIYGVAITPVLLAALAWKRATKTAGIVSIISATIVCVCLKVAGYIWPSIMKPFFDPNADPFGIPILYPSLIISMFCLFAVSILCKPPLKKHYEQFFKEKKIQNKSELPSDNLNLKYLIRFRIYFSSYLITWMFLILTKLYFYGTGTPELVIINLILYLILGLISILFLFNLPMTCKLLGKNPISNVLLCFFVPFYLVFIGLYWPTKYWF